MSWSTTSSTAWSRPATCTPGRPTSARAQSLRCHHERGEDHRPPVLDRDPRLGPRPALLPRLDHHRGQPVPGHGGVAHQEVVPLRRSARPELRKHQATPGDLLLEFPVRCRVGPVNSSSDNANRPAPRPERGPVGRGVDAQGQPAQHGHAAGHEFPGHPGRDVQPARGRLSGTRRRTRPRRPRTTVPRANRTGGAWWMARSRAG